MADKPVIALLRGPLCPNCENDESGQGIAHQQGLHQDPIIQCWFCAARIFVGDGDYRHVIPEATAPPIRPDFATPKPFNDGLDGFNRMIATIAAEVAEHERKAVYWRGRLEQAKAQRARYMGLHTGLVVAVKA